jgi:hypothetical protein
MPLPQNRKLLPKREIFQKQVAARANRFNKQDEQELQQTRHKSVVAEMQDNSAVGFAAMANANDFDDGFVPKLKEEAIVAAAEAEAGLRRFELLHIAIAGGKIAVGAVKDVEGGLTVNVTEIDAGFVGPEDGHAHDLFFTHRPNSRRTSS